MSRIDTLRAALEDLLKSLGGGRKSCGHDYECVCATHAARAALAATAAREQSSASIIQTILDLTRPMQGKDRNQPGWHIDSGWNSALLQVADVLRTLLAPLPQQAAPEQVGPVAWMTEDGRVCNDDTKRNMPRLVKESFNIPLFLAAPTAQAIPAGQDAAMQRFLDAYYKAAESSNGDDWMEAALLAKQWHCALIVAPPPPVAQQEDAKDAERLNWLQQTQSTVYRHTCEVREPKTDGSGGYWKREQFLGWAVDGPAIDGEPMPSVREAIDAAIAATKKGDAS